MKSFAYHPAAQAELEAEMSWREGERRDAGKHRWSDIDASLSPVQRFPEAGPVGLHGLRRVVTRPYHFIIHYEISTERIIVWTVAHPARQPGYWLARRPT